MSWIFKTIVSLYPKDLLKKPMISKYNILLQELLLVQKSIKIRINGLSMEYIFLRCFAQLLSKNTWLAMSSRPKLRDLTAEQAAEKLRNLSTAHYRHPETSLKESDLQTYN